MALLRRAAERAVDLRKQWEKAAGISDRKQRVAALWPFLGLHTYGVSFLKHTESELQKAAPAAGEYFADRLDEMTHNERMLLLPKAGAYGSKRLHDKLIKHLNERQDVYEAYVASSGRLPREVEWSFMPGNAQMRQARSITELADSLDFMIKTTCLLLERLRYGRPNTIWNKQRGLQSMHFEICPTERTFQL